MNLSLSFAKPSILPCLFPVFSVRGSLAAMCPRSRVVSNVRCLTGLLGPHSGDSDGRSTTPKISVPKSSQTPRPQSRIVVGRLPLCIFWLILGGGNFHLPHSSAVGGAGPHTFPLLLLGPPCAFVRSQNRSRLVWLLVPKRCVRCVNGALVLKELLSTALRRLLFSPAAAISK